MIETWTLTIPNLTPDQERRAYVYVPDSFEEDPELRYPVLYMFDGHNLFFDEDATYGKSWGMLEFLEESQLPLIVAAVECSHDPNNGRLSEYSPFTCHIPELGGKLKGKGKATMDWYVRVFKPYVDEHFPTIPDRKHTFIGGSSMGGLMSLYAITKYNRYFSRAACLSPSIWFATDQLNHLLHTAFLRKDTVIYMDYGAKELHNHPNMVSQFRHVTSILLDRHVNLTSRIVPRGDHSEGCWEKQIPIFMEILFYDLRL